MIFHFITQGMDTDLYCKTILSRAYITHTGKTESTCII